MLSYLFIVNGNFFLIQFILMDIQFRLARKCIQLVISLTFYKRRLFYMGRMPIYVCVYASRIKSVALVHGFPITIPSGSKVSRNVSVSYKTGGNIILKIQASYQLSSACLVWLPIHSTHAVELLNRRPYSFLYISFIVQFEKLHILFIHR